MNLGLFGPSFNSTSVMDGGTLPEARSSAGHVKATKEVGHNDITCYFLYIQNCRICTATASEMFAQKYCQKKPQSIDHMSQYVISFLIHVFKFWCALPFSPFKLFPLLFCYIRSH